MNGKYLRKVRKAAVLSFLRNSFASSIHALEKATRPASTIIIRRMKVKRDRSSAFVKEENGVLLRDIKLIRERSVRWLYTLLSAKSQKLDPNIAEGLDQWPENMPLDVQSMVKELTDIIRSLANGKVVGPDGVSVELFKITLNGDPARRRRLLDIVDRIWREGEVLQH